MLHIKKCAALFSIVKRKKQLPLLTYISIRNGKTISWPLRRLDYLGLDLLRQTNVFSTSSSTAKAKMPKQDGRGKHLKSKKFATDPNPARSQNRNSPISVNAKNSILINILAKPGAKHNSIIGISGEGITVQIAAPPVDGEANAELLKFMSSVLGVKKSAISLDRGSRPRTKVLILEPCADLSVDILEERIASHLS